MTDELVAPATMAMAGPRFLGCVIGGAQPVAVAADWLTTAWDQNTLFAEATPGSVMLALLRLQLVHRRDRHRPCGAGRRAVCGRGGVEMRRSVGEL